MDKGAPRPQGELTGSPCRLYPKPVEPTDHLPGETGSLGLWEPQPSLALLKLPGHGEVLMSIIEVTSHCALKFQFREV